jgi:hypothetical protein
MPTYKDWDDYFAKIPAQKLLQYRNAIEVLMKDTMIHKNWGELSTLAVLMENEIHRRTRVEQKGQRPIITGSYSKPKKGTCSKCGTKLTPKKFQGTLMEYCQKCDSYLDRNALIEVFSVPKRKR